MQPLIRTDLPFCSLTCDEIRDHGGRRVCRLTEKAITTRAVEGGVLCVPAVRAEREFYRLAEAELRERIRKLEAGAEIPAGVLETVECAAVVQSKPPELTVTLGEHGLDVRVE